MKQEPIEATTKLQQFPKDQAYNSKKPQNIDSKQQPKKHTSEYHAVHCPSEALTEHLVALRQGLLQVVFWVRLCSIAHELSLLPDDRDKEGP